MSEIRFPIKEEFIELFKLLKVTGLAESGGAAKHAISEGRVKVNGAPELRKAFKVRPGHTIDFEGALIQVQ